MRQQDEFKEALREIRRRKIRRIYDPLLASLEDDLEDESPLGRYRRRYRALLREQKLARGEKGKRPTSIKPSWSLPAGAGRGRPLGQDRQRIPHTRLHVGGHGASSGAVAASGNERYIRRHELASERGEGTPVAAAGNDDYLNRLERDAIGEGAPSAMRTNMDPDPGARDAEWLARTRHERKAGKPRINIHADRDPTLCRRIADDPRWPAKLRFAISADLDRHGRGLKRPKSKAAGEPWIDDRAEAVLDEIRATYGLDADASDPVLALGRPRAGRVFYKWEAELPRGLSEQERQALLDGMAADLDETGIRYVLVMHRPDPTNHPDNYHAHLLYSDRPVDKVEGGYDIERLHQRDYGRGRHRTVHQRQPKLRAVSDRAWARSLRDMLVRRSNETLERSGASWRYHGGGFADIGIADEERQRKLGSAAARLEAAGVATEIGVENALIDWDRVDKRRAARRERRLARIAAVEAAMLTREDPASAAVIAQWRAAAERTEHARAAAEEVADTMAMAVSRPRDVIGKAGAIADTYPAGSYEDHCWRARAEEARIAERVIEAGLSQERALLARARAAEAEHRHERDMARRAIGRIGRGAPSSAPTIAVSPSPALSSDPRLAHRFISRHERDGVEIDLTPGKPPYPAAMLTAAGLDTAAFQDPAIVRRLRELHARQRTEIAAVGKLAARRFVLPERSDTAYVRDVIARWRDHPSVRAAFEEAGSGTSTPMAARELRPVAEPVSSKAPGAAPVAVGRNDQQDRPPVFDDHDPPARIRAFKTGGNEPTDQLLMLLMLAGEHPRQIAVASDGKLMALPGSPSLLAPLLHGWREDERASALIAETVRASRAAGRATWPAEVSARVRAFAARSNATARVAPPMPERGLER